MSKSRFSQTGFALLGLTFAAAAMADARAGETSIAGSFELRGGYDSNPSLSTGAAGTATAGYAANLALAHKESAYVAGATLEAGATHYLDGGLEASRSQKVALSIATSAPEMAAVTASIGIDNSQTYDTVYREALASLRVKSRNRLVRPFITAELAAFELNESNVLTGDFLPSGQVALRGTIIPGIERTYGPATLGVSVNLTVIRYREPYDLFGFRRDNERVQPFLYGELEKGGWRLFGAVSMLYGDWHDVDFTDLAEPLFEVQASYEADAWRVSLDASRRAVETTFPVSPVTIDTSVSASVSRAVGRGWRAGVTGGFYETLYPDSPFRTRTVSGSLDVTRKLADDVVVGVKVGVARSWPWSGGVADEIYSQITLGKSFAERPLGAGS